MDKKSDYQRFLDFKIRHSLSDEKIANIVREYALLNDEFARTYVATRAGISEHVFYRCRDYAIIYMLVDQKTCKKVKEKAFRNQASHNDSKNFTSSVYHYQDLIKLRRKYLESFPLETIKDIAQLYSEGCSLWSIRNKYKITHYTCQKLLAFALINHLVDWDTFEEIRERSNFHISDSNYKGPTAQKLWSLKKLKNVLTLCVRTFFNLILILSFLHHFLILLKLF